MFQKPPLPSPARGGSASPGVRTLSHAAQKFVRNVIAKSSSSVDGSLRAITPKSGRSSTRLGTDSILGSRSPSVRDGSNPVRDGSIPPCMDPFYFQKFLPVETAGAEAEFNATCLSLFTSSSGRPLQYLLIRIHDQTLNCELLSVKEEDHKKVIHIHSQEPGSKVVVP
ncbi:hypothetical protein C5167_017046 [Papaver somniferum]|uniref:Uncharacterized protein n=1 Tax=Papaver somniferum TaxID=3469 RepID=A0A4Y7ILG2_PAPSO|nr:hypothetical protein C5167_017046 [Papaver somniferum]